MDFEKDKYWIWLSYVPKMWYQKAMKVMTVFDTPEELYKADEKKLEKSGIFTREDIYNIVNSRDKICMEDKWNELAKKNVRFTHIHDTEYPERLIVYEDKPLWLYYKGKMPEKNEKLSGMVGARNCSNYGRSMAETVAGKLSRYSVGIISGMARGIDAAAHLGAIKAGGKTYAVLGCGVDICYPRENIDIYMQIIENGAVISEYPPGTQPLAWQFPERNRIISMFAENVAIMEARLKSGSLITTDYALKYGKEVFALPGRVGDVFSEGCNELIKSGASLLTDADDMVFSTGIYMEKISVEKNIILEKENEVVYSCLDLLPQSIEELVEKTGMTSMKVYEVMMKLVLEGLVLEPVRNHFAKKI